MIGMTLLKAQSLCQREQPSVVCAAQTDQPRFQSAGSLFAVQVPQGGHLLFNRAPISKHLPGHCETTGSRVETGGLPSRSDYPLHTPF